MPWVRLDDSIDTHRKIRRAGNEASGVWMRSLCYSAGALTDGHVDPEWLAERAGKRSGRLLASVCGQVEIVACGQTNQRRAG